MHIWYLEDWKNVLDISEERHRFGLRLRFDAGVDETVKVFCRKFAKWLRREFFFPIRVVVYIKASYRIKAQNGKLFTGTFLRPEEYSIEPYARLAAGDYREMVNKWGEEEAEWHILYTFAHELTHYFQYINDLPLTLIGEERQATMYSRYIVDDYYDYVDAGECIKRKKNIWRSYNWEKNIDLDRENHRTGLSLRIDTGIDKELSRVCKDFTSFLREEYFFPVRITVYIKNSSNITNTDGGRAESIFWRIEDDYTKEPYIRIAAGEYAVLCEKMGKDNVVAKILMDIARELTHYFQWINDLPLTPVGEKRQATIYAKSILNDYVKAKEERYNLDDIE